MFSRPRRSTAAVAAAAAALIALTTACPATATVSAAPSAAGPLPLALSPAGPLPAGPLPAGPLPSGPLPASRAAPPNGPSSGEQGSALSAIIGNEEGGLTTLGVGGTAYTVPDVAMPYLGHGLDLNLFQDEALLTEEQTGRLPVRVGYQGHTPPALPGVTLTRHAAGIAEGYLTTASARRFGAALARQYRTDRRRATYGLDGMFAHGVSLSLTTPATTHSTRESLPSRTLTVTATNLAGKPDTGDMVIVTNVDNSNRFNLSHPVGIFHDGVATLKVPAGHYWAVGAFGVSKTSIASVQRVTVLPQISVLGNATVHMAEAAANSEITTATPRPAKAQAANFWMLRSGHSGPPVLLGWSNVGSRYPIRVSPTTVAPQVGTLRAYASQQLASTPGAAGAVPYWYAVDYADPAGTIPAQHYVVRAATLTTVNERYYQAGPAAGSAARSWAQVDGTAPHMIDGGIALGYVNPAPFRITTPGRLTEYLGGNMPAMTWSSSYQTSSGGVFQGDEFEPFHGFHPGGRVTDTWNAYPLHPAVSVNPDPAAWPNLDLPSATRSGNTLRLYVSPFGDNEPGHIGSGFTRVAGNKITGSYQIDQDGKKIAGGSPPPSSFKFGSFATKVQLSARPSVVSFALNAARTGPDFPLSTASHTVWTWRSAHEAGVTLPPGWYCFQHGTTLSNACDVQPMMTLDYAVAGMSLTGQVPAGRQDVSVTVGHLQAAKTAAVTRATMSVSFDGGQTWHAARMTGSHGHYQAVFDAPAGAYVMTCTTASDAAGGSVAETITRAFQVRA